MPENLRGRESHETQSSAEEAEKVHMPPELMEKIRIKEKLELKVEQLEFMQQAYLEPIQEGQDPEEYQTLKESFLKDILRTQKEVSRLDKQLHKEPRTTEAKEYLMQNADGLNIRVTESQTITVEIGEEMNLRVDKLTLKSAEIQTEIFVQRAERMNALMKSIERTENATEKTQMMQEQMLIAESIKDEDVIDLEMMQSLDLLSEEDVLLQQQLILKREEINRMVARIRRLDEAVDDINSLFAEKGVHITPYPKGTFMGQALPNNTAEAVQSFSFTNKNGEPVSFGVAMETIRVDGVTIEAGNYFVQSLDEDGKVQFQQYRSQAAMEMAFSTHLPIPEGKQLSFMPDIDGKRVSVVAASVSKSLGLGIAAGALYETVKYLRSGRRETYVETPEEQAYADEVLKHEISHSDNPEEWIDSAPPEQLERIEEVTLKQEDLKEMPDLRALTNLKIVKVEGQSMQSLGGGEKLPDSITTLDLSDNQIKDLSGLDKYKNLEYLDLSGNNLQSMDLATLGGKNVLASLTKLRELDLSENTFRELPMHGLDRLNNLRKLDVSGNKLRELPEELNRLVWLDELNASGNWIEEIPDWMGKFERLTRLDMAGNPVKYITPELMNLKRLWYLDITQHMAYDTDPKLLSALKTKVRFARVLPRENVAPFEASDMQGGDYIV